MNEVWNLDRMYTGFDDPKYQPLLEKKLVLMKKYISKPWKIKFYIYIHPKMRIRQMIERVEWCRKNECLPYVMRDIECWDAEKSMKEFLIDYAAYCNQPSMFKKLTFEEFMYKRHKNNERIQNSIKIYKMNKCD